MQSKHSYMCLVMACHIMEGLLEKEHEDVETFNFITANSNYIYSH